MSESSESTITITELTTDSGDQQRFAHYVDKVESTEALVYGYPVIALCGKYWIPSRDPKKYPICPTCAELYAEMVD